MNTVFTHAEAIDAVASVAGWGRSSAHEWVSVHVSRCEAPAGGSCEGGEPVERGTLLRALRADNESEPNHHQGPAQTEPADPAADQPRDPAEKPLCPKHSAALIKWIAMDLETLTAFHRGLNPPQIVQVGTVTTTRLRDEAQARADRTFGLIREQARMIIANCRADTNCSTADGDTP
jgi:hypothetical protein